MFCRLLCPPLWLRFFDLAIFTYKYLYKREREKKKKKKRKGFSIYVIFYFYLVTRIKGKKCNVMFKQDEATLKSPLLFTCMSFVTFFFFFFHVQSTTPAASSTDTTA